MISIGEKCCGCTACYAICKKKCINMLPNDEGFLYPVVDVKKCVNCGLCDKVCPIENKIQGVSPIRSVVLRTKVEEDVLNSASGGFSIPLANYVIKNGGVVCGAIINEKHEVQHKLIDNYEDINLIRGSKYVQSYMNNCFQEIKNKIEYLQLSNATDFVEKMRAASFIPHTNLDLYPTVKKELIKREVLK